MSVLRAALLLCSLAFARANSRPSRPPSTLQEEVANQGKCVETPQEYIAAFEAEAPRCVSPCLFGRITHGATVEEALPTSSMFSVKVAYYVSGSDVLAKYLRIGYPDVPGLSTAWNDSGLTAVSNGVALLEQVGYSKSDLNASSVYVLNVFPEEVLKAATAELAGSLPFGGGMPPSMATWDIVRAFYEQVYQEQGLVVPHQALGVLKTTTFADLSGCPAQCAYAVPARYYPNANYTSPLVVLPRGADGKCPPAPVGTKPTPPTAFETTSELCSDEWKEAYNATASLFPPQCSPEANAEAGAGLARLVNATDGPTPQALLFRTFLMQYCAGDSNSIWSGDGYTYTGTDGTLAPLGTEFLVSPFNVSWSEGAIASIPFCISATNEGRPNADGVCELPGQGAEAAGAATSRRLLSRGAGGRRMLA
ncbi:protocadherin-related 15 [Micractinium conductrix]|uniref:Protocadherin-related 15 n=1 Tax=Micractinium conductrix TaxID=554055 RepID=A0A2P6VKE6_9CHLO|nr:protocadherin-related 15 [Micractinium conductrix]|eukprot:PSC74537.1 protocadherin-related 15 [Micractinium conductrix]